MGVKCWWVYDPQQIRSIRTLQIVGCYLVILKLLRLTESRSEGSVGNCPSGRVVFQAFLAQRNFALAALEFAMTSSADGRMTSCETAL